MPHWWKGLSTALTLVMCMIAPGVADYAVAETSIVVLGSQTKTDHRQFVEGFKQYLVEQDCDFHQSTGADRIIIGVVGDTSRIDREALGRQPGVLDVYCIPQEN